MKIGLVTDSTADISARLVEKYRLEVVPALIVLDGKSFADGIEISREEFYNRLPNLKGPATTAAPSVGSFAARYEKLLVAGAQTIFSIHAASSLSGIFNAARLAAESFGGRVRLVDSGQLSLGTGFQVLDAAEAISSGAESQEVATILASIQEGIKLVAALDSLDYLRRSGRVSWAKARVTSLLKLKPIIALAHGNVESLGAVRTTRRADAHLLAVARRCGVISRLAVLHTNAEERARNFLAALAPNLSVEPMLVNVTPVIGAHLGPNGLGFALQTSLSERIRFNQ